MNDYRLGKVTTYRPSEQKCDDLPPRAVGETTRLRGPGSPAVIEMIHMGLLQYLLSRFLGQGSAPTQSYSFGQPSTGYSGASYSGGGGYNRVINMVGATGKSEAEVRSAIASQYFSEKDINSLCASPTFRQMMGWG